MGKIGTLTNVDVKTYTKLFTSRGKKRKSVSDIVNDMIIECSDKVDFSKYKKQHDEKTTRLRINISQEAYEKIFMIKARTKLPMGRIIDILAENCL